MVCCIRLHKPPQSPDLNPVEKVWDELCRKKKQPTNAQHMCALLEKLQDTAEEAG